jgi:hypothetical protein
MAQTQIRVPTYLVREFKKSPKIFEDFFDNLIDLVRYLKNEGYIEDDVMEKWVEGLAKASQYSNNYDVGKALEGARDILRGIEDILVGIKANAFLRTRSFPMSLENKLVTIAKPICEFTYTLSDIVDYYEIINNISLASKSTWSDEVHNICYYVEYGEYDKPIESIINMIRYVEPLIDAIRNQLMGGPNDS